jgi:hypothetical protein
MQTRSRKIANLCFIAVFIVGLLPACSPPADNKTNHEQEDALLLQISSHVRLSGEPDLGSYVMSSSSVQKTAFTHPAFAPATKNEIDIYVDLYTTYLGKLQSQGNLTDRNVDRLVDQLDAKVKSLARRSQRLEQRRRRRRRGLAGLFRRVGRGIGRFIRQLGRGVGKAAEYLIKEVAPDVIRDMVLTGQPLTAKVFWKGVRKVVRSRLKRAVGTNLAKKGVPPEILAEAGLGIEEEPGEEEITEDQPERPDIGYGDHTVDVQQSEGNFGYFTWKNYWTDLPETFEYRCQTYSSPTADVDAYLDNYTLELDFKLDAGTLGSSTSGEGEYDLLPVYFTDWVYTLELEEGWVKPSPDATGWTFGGTVVFDVTLHDQWRCFHCIPDNKGYCADVQSYYLEDEKSTSVQADLEGWTEQVVPGEGDEPDRLEPGGTYSLTIFYEGEDAELLLDCEDCKLPADFPPPVYLEQ